MEGTRIPKKVLKAKSEGVRSVGKPREDGKMGCNRMLPAFCAVATGSWPLMTEHCGGRRQRMPRPDLGCSAIGWVADGYIIVTNSSISRWNFITLKVQYTTVKHSRQLF
jgi:hypothetical protein